MQNRASCQCGRYIPRRYALSDTHLQTLGLGGEQERKERKKRKERERKNGREAEIGVEGGEGDRVEKSGVFLSEVCTRRTNARTRARLHVYTHARRYDVACAGACKKRRAQTKLARAKELAGV